MKSIILFTLLSLSINSIAKADKYVIDQLQANPSIVTKSSLERAKKNCEPNCSKLLSVYLKHESRVHLAYFAKNFAQYWKLESTDYIFGRDKKLTQFISEADLPLTKKMEFSAAYGLYDYAFELGKKNEGILMKDFIGRYYLCTTYYLKGLFNKSYKCFSGHTSALMFLGIYYVLYLSNGNSAELKKNLKLLEPNVLQTKENGVISFYIILSHILKNPLGDNVIASLDQEKLLKDYVVGFLMSQYYLVKRTPALKNFYSSYQKKYEGSQLVKALSSQELRKKFISEYGTNALIVQLMK